MILYFFNCKFNNNTSLYQKCNKLSPKNNNTNNITGCCLPSSHSIALHRTTHNTVKISFSKDIGAILKINLNHLYILANKLSRLPACNLIELLQKEEKIEMHNPFMFYITHIKCNAVVCLLEIYLICFVHPALHIAIALHLVSVYKMSQLQISNLLLLHFIIKTESHSLSLILLNIFFLFLLVKSFSLTFYG